MMALNKKLQDHESQLHDVILWGPGMSVQNVIVTHTITEIFQSGLTDPLTLPPTE